MTIDQCFRTDWLNLLVYKYFGPLFAINIFIPNSDFNIKHMCYMVLDRIKGSAAIVLEKINNLSATGWILYAFCKQTLDRKSQINLRRSADGRKLRGHRASARSWQHSLRVLRHRSRYTNRLELKHVNARLRRFQEALQRSRLFVAVSR